MSKNLDMFEINIESSSKVCQILLKDAWWSIISHIYELKAAKQKIIRLYIKALKYYSFKLYTFS